MSFDIQGPAQTPQQKEEASRANDEHVSLSFGTGDAYKLDMNYHKMADFIGLNDQERMDQKVANKVAYLRDFTKEVDDLDAMIKIRDLKKSMGLQSKGKDLLNNLYQYARLIQERQRIDKEMSLISNKDGQSTNG